MRSGWASAGSGIGLGQASAGREIGLGPGEQGQGQGQGRGVGASVSGATAAGEPPPRPRGPPPGAAAHLVEAGELVADGLEAGVVPPAVPGVPGGGVWWGSRLCSRASGKARGPDRKLPRNAFHQARTPCRQTGPYRLPPPKTSVLTGRTRGPATSPDRPREARPAGTPTTSAPVVRPGCWCCKTLAPQSSPPLSGCCLARCRCRAAAGGC